MSGQDTIAGVPAKLPVSFNVPLIRDGIERLALSIWLQYHADTDRNHGGKLTMCRRRAQSDQAKAPETQAPGHRLEQVFHFLLWSPFVIFVVWLAANLVMAAISCVTGYHEP